MRNTIKAREKTWEIRVGKLFFLVRVPITGLLLSGLISRESWHRLYQKQEFIAILIAKLCLAHN